MSPESSLKSQQSFQGLVYLPDFTIQSFFMMFAAFATEWCFFRQFLENGGLPFRLNPREYIAQLRIATTAKTDLFIANWLDFDKAAPARKATQSEEDRAAKKEVLTYIDVSAIMTEMSVTYARALQYLKVPTPTAGEYPTGDETATNLMVRLAHLHGNGQYFTGQANAVNSSNSRRHTPAPAPAPSPSPSPSTRGTARKVPPTADATRPFVHAKDLKTPTKITTKNGQKNHIFPLTYTNSEKDEWLGKNLKPKQDKRCRKSTKFDAILKIYTRCYMNHYTHEHDKLFPNDKNVKMVQLESAGEYADRHPLSEHPDAVSPGEWDRYFPHLPCYGVTATTTPHSTSSQKILQNIRARKVAAKTILPQHATLPTLEEPQEQSQIFTHAPSYFDDVALFVACFLIFLACTWAFGAFTVFAQSAAVPSNLQRVSDSMAPWVVTPASMDTGSYLPASMLHFLWEYDFQYGFLFMYAMLWVTTAIVLSLILRASDSRWLPSTSTATVSTQTYGALAFDKSGNLKPTRFINSKAQRRHDEAIAMRNELRGVMAASFPHRAYTNRQLTSMLQLWGDVNTVRSNMIGGRSRHCSPPPMSDIGFTMEPLEEGNDEPVEFADLHDPANDSLALDLPRDDERQPLVVVRRRQQAGRWGFGFSFGSMISLCLLFLLTVVTPANATPAIVYDSAFAFCTVCTSLTAAMEKRRIRAIILGSYTTTWMFTSYLLDRALTSRTKVGTWKTCIWPRCDTPTSLDLCLPTTLERTS
jgi:hypothetical protein